jgi:hypothetical protein
MHQDFSMARLILLYLHRRLPTTFSMANAPVDSQIGFGLALDRAATGGKASEA